jgi:hypothetical protein
MPYQTHFAFISPSDDTARLWRYMDLAQLLTILDRQELFFPSVATLAEGDPYEGEPVIAKIEAARAKGVDEVRRLRLQADVFKHLNFFNCWHMNDSESDAMWKIYSKVSAGVAIQSSVSRLRASFVNTPDTVLMGVVEYVDPDKMPTSTTSDPMFGGFSDYMFKRTAFAHEREVRVGTYRADVRFGFFDSAGFIKVREPGTTANQVLLSPDRKGVYVAVDVPTLIERLVISPYAPNWFSDLVTSLVGKLGYTFDIVSSEMSRPSALSV